jgi:hypothetical protein
VRRRAKLADKVLDIAQAEIAKAVATRVRGTYDPKASYSAGDLVALEGSSFLAKRDDPGQCPHSGSWQLVAKGSRGVRGERGERGVPGKSISGWIVDRGKCTVTPRFNDGSLGPALDLSTLFTDGEPDGTQP